MGQDDLTRMSSEARAKLETIHSTEPVSRYCFLDTTKMVEWKAEYEFTSPGRKDTDSVNDNSRRFPENSWLELDREEAEYRIGALLTENDKEPEISPHNPKQARRELEKNQEDLYLELNTILDPRNMPTPYSVDISVDQDHAIIQLSSIMSNHGGYNSETYSETFRIDGEINIIRSDH